MVCPAVGNLSVIGTHPSAWWPRPWRRFAKVASSTRSPSASSWRRGYAVSLRASPACLPRRNRRAGQSAGDVDRARYRAAAISTTKSSVNTRRRRDCCSCVETMAGLARSAIRSPRECDGRYGGYSPDIRSSKRRLARDAGRVGRLLCGAPPKERLTELRSQRIRDTRFRRPKQQRDKIHEQTDGRDP